MSQEAKVGRVSNKRGFGANLREEILSAAERLLAASGSSDVVTLRAIARETGIAAPSVYPHFSDRDAILDAVVARTFTALAEECRAAAAASHGVAKVEAICLAYLAFARNSPGQYRILFERSPANIASPPHQYAEGIAAFAMLVDALGDIAGRDVPDSMLEAQSIFVALHGIATLTVALPGFPWADQTVLVRTLIAKSVGRPTD
ncbi:TetR/AcrR family transcriptional regulator [Jatrophihabitans sp.]|uniref:TetR/AcrR family transcriptional regulator n=1 Tax=Jatrophihabitans sp. TaxID=1932789 RepID=UPI0030C66906|nr:transcriptional regulatory protein [Jatrophihabitans sp.]